MYLGMAHNVWAYPLIASFTMIGRFTFIFATTLLTMAFYLIGELATRVLWGKSSVKLHLLSMFYSRHLIKLINTSSQIYDSSSTSVRSVLLM